MLGDLVSNLRATLPDNLAGVTMTLDVESVYTTQDVATPLCFLVTELVELAISVSASAALRVSVSTEGLENRAMLAIRSTALAASSLLDELLRTRYGRVLEGLSRQLRTPLIKDPDGVFSIAFQITGHD
ncbi:hypothetical protein GWI34_44430 [Actinomadura sp. DSM 109109]|nr:hypothetical protein [Actinomadura lepetitiana]